MALPTPALAGLMCKALFVYGTLAPGEENAHIMDGMNGRWIPATVRAKRYDTGWGAQKGHPGLKLDKNAGIVKGLVFLSEDLPQNWDRLDTFEGSDYHRVTIKATLKNGDIIDAQVYSVV